MAKYLYGSFAISVCLTLSFVAATTREPFRPEPSRKTSEPSVSYSPQPQHFPNERLYQAYLVIQRFKSSISSDPKNITTTWSGHDICGRKTYLGFHCGRTPELAKNLTIMAVAFNDFGLSAPMLRGFIDQLPDLVLFQASSNKFGGGIPPLGSLQYQYKLSIHDDRHDSFSESKYLLGTNLGLGPVNIGVKLAVVKTPRKGTNLNSGRALLLNSNSLSGTLPANLGFSKLSYLALANNKLTGAIPPSIAHMQDSLLEMLLLNNQLSGCLPNELGMLTKTAVIDAGMNQLTGPIPSSFSCLSSVEQLNLAGNRLYGQVPDALCKLAGPAGRLSNLTLSGNYFTSVGTACSALIKDGVLDVKHNCIPGFANQRGLAECATFLSQPKTCPAASARVACPAADAKMNTAAPEGKVAKDYSSYVVYATLHE
ncbi:hypothetical protein CFC21_092839 [Triticum aestivum]|uniref:Leucine-rich repeat-containing N-terminal plant-type domain-containing protein n=2 Tax=Triticum aestivum TaxID=4565 RepID=A0A3B6QHA0_WHEAT|nr:uncharacterized protein At4g06744-like [Triticum aestivum]KAF7090004.1 hypothetical protein CFC21_092839 [Triticum aestivum]